MTYPGGYKRMKWNEFCSYRLSMMGRQSVKAYIIYEKNSLVRKLWLTVILFVISAAAFAYLYYEILFGNSEYIDQFNDLAVVFALIILLTLVSFFCLMRFGYNRCLGRKSDLRCMKKGNYRVDTIYVAGSYRASRSGSYAVMRTLFEGRRDYVNGSLDGSPVHAVNLIGIYENGSYHPCVVLDNNSVYALPRSYVSAPRK